MNKPLKSWSELRNTEAGSEKETSKETEADSREYRAIEL